MWTGQRPYQCHRFGMESAVKKMQSKITRRDRVEWTRVSISSIISPWPGFAGDRSAVAFVAVPAAVMCIKGRRYYGTVLRHGREARDGVEHVLACDRKNLDVRVVMPSRQGNVREPEGSAWALRHRMNHLHTSIHGAVAMLSVCWSPLFFTMVCPCIMACNLFVWERCNRGHRRVATT
eukprot:SAG11_NODE_8894_length_965_cov_1.073903_1_plen_178_part_00